MNNTTIPSLLTRVVKLRSSFQNVGATTWNAWARGDRAGFILGCLDTEAVRYDDHFSYDVFFKAYHSSKYESIHLADLDYSQIMEVFDLADRYAENWIFS